MADEPKSYLKEIDPDSRVDWILEQFTDVLTPVAKTIAHGILENLGNGAYAIFGVEDDVVSISVELGDEIGRLEFPLGDVLECWIRVSGIGIDRGPYLAYAEEADAIASALEGAAARLRVVKPKQQPLTFKFAGDVRPLIPINEIALMAKSLEVCGQYDLLTNRDILERGEMFFRKIPGLGRVAVRQMGDAIGGWPSPHLKI